MSSRCTCYSECVARVPWKKKKYTCCYSECVARVPWDTTPVREHRCTLSESTDVHTGVPTGVPFDSTQRTLSIGKLHIIPLYWWAAGVPCGYQQVYLVCTLSQKYCLRCTLWLAQTRDVGVLNLRSLAFRSDTSTIPLTNVMSPALSVHIYITHSTIDDREPSAENQW